MGSKKNKDDVAKQKLLQEQQAQDRARLLAETTRAQSQQDMYNQQYGQLAEVLGRESAADRALQERLMGQQFEQAGQDRGVFQSAMDRYLDQQQEDRGTFQNLLGRAQQQTPLEQEYAGGMTDWFKFMNGGQSGTPQAAAAGGDEGRFMPLPRVIDENAKGYTPVSQSYSMPAGDAIATTPNARYRDYTNAPGLIHSGLFEQAQKRREDERTALGARQFGANAMNPTLLGLQKQAMGDQASQRFGAQAAKAVTDRDAQMRADVMPYLGFNAGRQQGLLNTAQGGASQLGQITNQLGGIAQGGAQNLLNLSASGARGGLGQLFGAATSGSQGLGSQLLSSAGNQSGNSTNLYTGFQVRESPSFLSQLLGPALQIGAGLATGGMSGLMGGLPKSGASMPVFGRIPGVGG